MRFSRIPTNRIHLHAVEAGPPGGPLLFLLHGFPEFWYGWRNHIEPLARHGFHVVAPDQRGYNHSDKPRGVGSYDLDFLAADILGLADHFGQETFSVAGHDWGASVGWWLATHYPQRLKRLVALNAPHPAVWLEAMERNPVQIRKSGYARFFRIPLLPEMLIGAKALAKGFADIRRPGAFTEEDYRRYRIAWSQPDALTAMLNWYRAVLRKPMLPAAEYRVSCPTLIIWGKRDAYAVPELAEESRRLCADARVEYFDECTHWVHHEEPLRIADLIAATSYPAEPGSPPAPRIVPPEWRG